MAELIIGAIVNVLFEKLASGDLSRLARSSTIHSELKKWSDTLTQIQAVLVDAGQKHIQDRSVELWLNKLHHYNHKMSSKLDEITSKLLDLVKEKQLLGLTDKVEKSVRASYRRLEETSLVDESKIIGREGDKESLLGKLVSSESSSSRTQNVNVVSIVGLGGIGKTTLARLLYNDEKVKGHFELRAWVCVSDEFNVFNISKTIFQAVGGGNRDFANLNLLQVALSEKLSKKKFLLVLDDVWNENYNEWEILQHPFTVGAAGSRVLVTTRKTMVASVMDSVEAYSLELLSDEEALSLFAQHASGRQNFDVKRTLKLYGEDIVKKCGRLPLALKALGRVFKTKYNVEEWEELLKSDIWNSHNESEILPALKLSYYDLPPHLKQMFVYCCLFPKDYMFKKDELVMLWMAEGFLYESNGNNSKESFGEECFEELLSRSFFQHLTNDKSLYTMHDLINDLASSIAGEFFLMLDDKMDISHTIEALEKCHHLSVFAVDGADHMLKTLKKGEHLRTYLANKNSYVSRNVLIEMLPQLQCLRVLSLASYYITEVPQPVCTLKHLRYLSFSNTVITCLPEQVGDLFNLQSLVVSHCDKLSSLPNSLVKLINLRHLDISHTRRLNKPSLRFIDWTNLQKLTKIVIGKDDVFAIYDLKGLLYLYGELSIKGIQEMKDAVHAKHANLQQIKGICDLHMEWSDVFDDTRNKATEYEVLEGLRPSEKLKSLEILYYGGRKLPSWVGDPSFVCLTKLTLRGCKSCKRLSALGQLPSLRELHVEGMDALEKLDIEFLGRFNSYQAVAFPSLEVLKFKDMESWEEWSTSGFDIAGVFPCLRELSMIRCEKLDAVAIELISPLWKLHVEECSLKKLEIYKCNNLVSLVEKELQSVTEVKISKCQRLESYNCPSSIEKLDIRDCKSLTSLSFPTMDKLPSTLKSLYIDKCDSLEVSWLANNFLSSLEHLRIMNMPNLRLLPEGCLVHLIELEISGCDNIESIPDNGYGFLPNCCLKKLIIWDCKNLKSFPYKHLQSFASLGEIEIYNCPSLDYAFPSGLWPPNLSALYIGGLKKPISEWGIQNFPTSLVKLELDGRYENSPGVVTFEKGKAGVSEIINSTSSFLLLSSSFLILPSSLITLWIWDFKELKSVSEGLQHLTSLQHLYIYNCQKLRDLPETLLSSLSTLSLFGNVSPELRKKCSREGKYWPIISLIPNLSVPN